MAELTPDDVRRLVERLAPWAAGRVPLDHIERDGVVAVLLGLGDDRYGGDATILVARKEEGGGWMRSDELTRSAS